MKQYIPNNFNIEEHLQEFPPDSIENFNKDNLIHILNLITEIPANRESYDSYNGFVPLNSTKLRKKIRNYKQYLDYLVNTEVFECDNQYIQGQKSKGYKFCERFTTKVKPEEVYKYTLVKKINRERQIDEKVQEKYGYLINWFDINLSIDYKGAYDFLENDFEVTSPFEKYIRKYNYSLRNIDQFHDQDFYYTVDSSVQRFHSNFTRMRKDFRGFISYQNQPLVAVDISNSQPYLSISLFSKDFYIQDENEVNSFNLFNIYQLYPNSLLSSTISFTPPPMLYKILEENDNQDVKNYVELTQNGLIYEYLASEIKSETGHEYKKRKDLKKVVFTVLFTGNQFIGQPSAIYKRIFKDRFPTVYKVFSCLKKGNKEFLPRLLQRMESHIVLDRICLRIANERPQLPIYTIHDSVVTIKGHEGYVKKVMEEELESCIGYKPDLKIEYWIINKE